MPNISVIHSAIVQFSCAEDIIVASLTDRCKNIWYRTSIIMVEQKATQEAYIHAYEQHADAIFRFVYFRTRDKEDARDIVQETFLRTWRYLAEGNEIDQLRPFLFRTARNILYDMTRQHTTRNTGSLDAFLEEGGTANMRPSKSTVALRRWLGSVPGSNSKRP